MLKMSFAISCQLEEFCWVLHQQYFFQGDIHTVQCNLCITEKFSLEQQCIHAGFAEYIHTDTANWTETQRYVFCDNFSYNYYFFSFYYFFSPSSIKRGTLSVITLQWLNVPQFSEEASYNSKFLKYPYHYRMLILCYHDNSQNKYSSSKPPIISYIALVLKEKQKG